MQATGASGRLSAHGLFQLEEVNSTVFHFPPNSKIQTAILPRIKLDPNRAIDEAAQGDPTAEAVYNDYHFYLEQAKQIVGRGILFDLHGQAHGQNSTEMGYLLLPEELVREEIKFIFTESHFSSNKIVLSCCLRAVVIFL